LTVAEERAGSVAMAVELREVEIRYGPRASIGPVDAELHAGHVLGLIGANGSGKTSILRAICGLQQAHAGDVRVFGRVVRAGVPVAGVGAMIEEPRFYPWLSAVDNLLLAAGGRQAWVAGIDMVLDAVGLGDVRDTAVAEFSQGMRQRLGIGRALLGKPRLMVLDEPTNGLDARGTVEIRGLLRAAVDQGTTLILTSHLLTEIEALADDLLVLNAGRQLHAGPTTDAVDRWGSVSAMYEHIVTQVR
jgi:ABC-2 type transport system ATP-binding protein